MDEFEEWKTWFDSHKEPDGSINLSKHHDLTDWLLKWAGMKKPNYNKLTNTGNTVSFDLSTLKKC